MPCVAVSRCSLIWPCRGSILHPSSSTSDAARYCPMPAHRTGVPFQSTCALYGLPHVHIFGGPPFQAKEPDRYTVKPRTSLMASGRCAMSSSSGVEDIQRFMCVEGCAVLPMTLPVCQGSVVCWLHTRA